MQKINKIIKYFSINSSRSMDWKKLVSITISLFFVSCISFYHHPKSGFRPKKPNFSLAKEKFKYNKLIDTSAIYVNIDTLKVEDLKSIFFLKFYNNGRFFEKSININKFEKGKMIPGSIGYYSINKNNIKVEYFEVSYFNKYKTQYIKQLGKIKGDTIFLNNRFIQGKKDIYVKQKLDFIPEPSNW